MVGRWPAIVPDREHEQVTITDGHELGALPHAPGAEGFGVVLVAGVQHALVVPLEQVGGAVEQDASARAGEACAYDHRPTAGFLPDERIAEPDRLEEPVGGPAMTGLAASLRQVARSASPRARQTDCSQRSCPSDRTPV